MGVVTWTVSRVFTDFYHLKLLKNSHFCAVFVNKLVRVEDEIIQANKNERANALKEVKRLCKEFGFTSGMLKGALAEGRKKS